MACLRKNFSANKMHVSTYGKKSMNDQGLSQRKLIVGYNLLTNRLFSSSIYQQIGLSLSFISNKMLISTIDIRQMCG